MENELTPDDVSTLLEKTDINIVLHAIQEEDEQSLAIFLLSLSPKHSARILAQLKPEKRNAVAKAIAKTETVPTEEVQATIEKLKAKIEEAASNVTTFGDGAESLAKLLSEMDRDVRSTILDSLEDEEPDVATRVKEQMFQFNDILLLTDNSLQRVLEMLDRNLLTLALQGASEEIQEKIFDNLSPDEVLQIRAQMERGDQVSPSIVAQAQRSILSVIRQLESRGMIMME